MKKFKKIFTAVVSFVAAASLVVTPTVSAKEKLVYGKAAGPYTELFEDGVKPILEGQGYEFEVVEFSDLLQNDTSLAEGETDFNVEQHTAYAEAFNEGQGADLTPIIPLPTVAAGLFSAKHDSIDEIEDGALVAVPADPSNAARAYLLLEKAGWITVDPEADRGTVSSADITDNPHNLEIIEVETAQIARTLDDFDYGVITGAHIHSAGIDVSTALLREDLQDDFVLQLVVRAEDKDEEWVKAIADAYQSEDFAKYLEENNDGLWIVPEYE